MIIEYQFAFHSINPNLVAIMSRGLLELYKIHADMMKAVVIFNEDKLHHSTDNKLCEIIVNFPGKDLYIYSMEDNFELSAMDALNKLQGILYKRMYRQRAKNKLGKEIGLLK